MCEETARECHAPGEETSPNDSLRIVDETSVIGSAVLLCVAVDPKQLPLLHSKDANGGKPILVEHLHVKRRSNLAGLGEEQQQRKDKADEQIEQSLHNSTVCG